MARTTAVTFDPSYPIHRKVSSLSDAAFRLAVEAIFWCFRNKTDGRIQKHELRTVTGIARPERQAAELVARGLWDETDTGWQVHDYLDWQPSADKAAQIAAARAAAGAEGGRRSGQTRRSRSGDRQRSNEAKPKQIASGLVPPPLLPPSGEGKGTARAAGASPPSGTPSGGAPVDDGRCPVHRSTWLPCGICQSLAAASQPVDDPDEDDQLGRRPPLPTRPPHRRERPEPDPAELAAHARACRELLAEGQRPLTREAVAERMARNRTTDHEP